MKRTFLFHVVFLILTVTPAFAGISGSLHDFSDEVWSGGKICKPCHTPHNADTTVVDSPLWNHEVTTTDPYTLYSSPTLDATMDQPRGVSKLCLSCHDGTIAIDSFGGSTTASTMISGPGLIGTDLSDDHPVSFDWGHESNTGGSCSQCHQSHPLAFISPLPFFDGRVECATCHDPHSGPGFDHMLRMTMTGSALCLHCHSNK